MLTETLQQQSPQQPSINSESELPIEYINIMDIIMDKKGLNQDINRICEDYYSVCQHKDQVKLDAKLFFEKYSFEILPSFLQNKPLTTITEVQPEEDVFSSSSQEKVEKTNLQKRQQNEAMQILISQNQKRKKLSRMKFCRH